MPRDSGDKNAVMKNKVRHGGDRLDKVLPKRRDCLRRNDIEVDIDRTKHFSKHAARPTRAPRAASVEDEQADTSQSYR